MPEVSGRDAVGIAALVALVGEHHALEVDARLGILDRVDDVVPGGDPLLHRPEAGVIGGNDLLGAREL